MIFGVLYFLVYSGYAAINVLLGPYLVRYLGAEKSELGLMFMILPLSIFTRPFICTQADRFQNHQSILKYCLLGTSLAYTPFIIIPYLLRIPSVNIALTTPIRFAIFGIAQLLGSICFCGLKTLVDVLAVNYAKRANTNFTIYRKWGTLSFGLFGYFIGYINQGWIVPDFVCSFIVYCASMFIGAVLTHLCPDEFFVIIGNTPPKDLPELPSGSELVAKVVKNLRSTLVCCCSDTEQKTNYYHSVVTKDSDKNQHLSNRQQLAIFWLLLRRDFRIPLFLLWITFGGMTAYAPLNFVFTYMNSICQTKRTCDGASLGGIMMLSYCITEIAMYLIVNYYRNHLNHIVMLQITFFCVSCHYLFYGLVLDHVSPYFFMVEALHGVEYALNLAASLDLARHFAVEVELILPELMKKGIIGERDNHELVKVSLIATMNGLFTLCYEGAGKLIMVAVYGVISDRYSFSTTWIVNGSISAAVFIGALVIIMVGKCFNIKPKIEKLRE